MSDKEQAAGFTAAHLNRTLPSIREPLFRMADQVVDDAAERDWNLIVGDDTNGRLPTYFIRHALRRVTGRRVRTVFVNASNAMRDSLGPQEYRDYFSLTLDDRTHRPLIVTESVGTGAALTFIRDALVRGAECDGVDAAAIASRHGKPEFLRYVGAEGNEALRSVFFCLEAIAGTSLKARTLTRARRLIPQSLKDALPQRLHLIGRPKTDANVLTGLYTPERPVLPVAESDHEHPLGAAYGALDTFLDEYVATRGGDTTSVIMEEYETL